MQKFKNLYIFATVFVVMAFAGAAFASTITTILGSDTLSASRTVINTNFSNLNTDKLESASIDTCAELAAIIGGETGTCGSLVLSADPTLTGTLTFANATGTSATTTDLAIGSVISAILKTNSVGKVVPAIAGTDYPGLSAQNTWTGHNVFSSLFATNASSTNATTTNLAVDGSTRLATSLNGLAFLTSGAVTGIATTTLNLTALSFADADWGDITIASNVASVEDDSHAHTGTTLSGIDISSDTNLSGDTEVVLTGDALSLGSAVARDSELPTGANPTGTIGLSTVNGSASTFLRSDGAPALSQSITPTWTGLHTFNTAGLIATASSTVQRLSSTNATSTNATSTNLYVSTDFIAPIERMLMLATSSMGTGTTTKKLSGYSHGATVLSMGCNSVGGGTFKAVLGDGSASSSVITSSTALSTTFTALSSNNTFTSGEPLFIAYGTVSGTVADPVCTFNIR